MACVESNRSPAMTAPSRRRQPRQLALVVGLACAATCAVVGGPVFMPAAGPQASSTLGPRRALLGGVAGAVAAAGMGAPAMAFELYQDAGLGVAFKYPTGLQKAGNNVYQYFLRDVLEPLESVGVRVIDSPRNSLQDIGDVNEVALKLLEDVVPQGAPKEILSAVSRIDSRGRRYDIIEFSYQWKFAPNIAKGIGRTRYQLHNKAIITIDRKRQFLLLACAEEDRWKSSDGILSIAVDTFTLL